MIPKSLWAQMLHSLVLYRHFPEHSHSLDWSGGASSSIHTLCYSLPPQFLMLISDHYPVYFVPSPLHMSIPPLLAPNFNQTLFEHLSVRSRKKRDERREIYTMKEERFTVGFPSLLFHASDILCRTSSKGLVFGINIQILISNFL